MPKRLVQVYNPTLQLKILKFSSRPSPGPASSYRWVDGFVVFNYYCSSVVQRLDCRSPVGLICPTKFPPNIKSPNLQLSNFNPRSSQPNPSPTRHSHKPPDPPCSRRLCHTNPQLHPQRLPSTCSLRAARVQTPIPSTGDSCTCRGLHHGLAIIHTRLRRARRDTNSLRAAAGRIGARDRRGASHPT